MWLRVSPPTTIFSWGAGASNFCVVNAITVFFRLSKFVCIWALLFADACCLNDCLLESKSCTNDARIEVAILSLYCSFAAAMLSHIESMKPGAFAQNTNWFCKLDWLNMAETIIQVVCISNLNIPELNTSKLSCVSMTLRFIRIIPYKGIPKDGYRITYHPVQLPVMTAHGVGFKLPNVPIRTALRTSCSGANNESCNEIKVRKE